MQKIQLLCLPYAGGSSAIYHKWEAYLDPRIRLVPVELAGRGRRIGEAFYRDRAAAVDDIFSQIKEVIGRLPYALFGHSLGAMLAYELSQKIMDMGLDQPAHCFFSGKSAPHLCREKKLFHLMGEEEFKKEILELGGTPPELFDSPELLSIFLPLLKADFRLVETELPDGRIRPLKEDITVFLGKDDDFTALQCDGWKKHTSRLCSIHYFEGGHFFLHDHLERLVRIVNNTLQVPELPSGPTNYHATSYTH